MCVLQAELVTVAARRAFRISTSRSCWQRRKTPCPSAGPRNATFLPSLTLALDKQYSRSTSDVRAPPHQAPLSALQPTLSAGLPRCEASPSRLLPRLPRTIAAGRAAKASQPTHSWPSLPPQPRAPVGAHVSVRECQRRPVRESEHAQAGHGAQGARIGSGACRYQQRQLSTPRLGRHGAPCCHATPGRRQFNASGATSSPLSSPLPPDATDVHG